MVGKVKEITSSQSMQNIIKRYQFMFISATLKWFPSKFPKKFVYTIKFYSTCDNSCRIYMNGVWKFFLMPIHCHYIPRVDKRMQSK